MKKLQITSWVTLLAGVVLKFIHIPGAGILMFLGAILLLVHSVLFAIKNHKKNIEKVFFVFSVSLMTIYVYGRIQFYSWPYSLFYFALIVSLVFLIMVLMKWKLLSIKHYVFVVYWMFFMLLPYVPSYKIFYLIRFNPIFQEESIDADYQGWDRYSWFLYLSDENDEALFANQKATHAAQKNAQMDNDQLASDYLVRLEEHRMLIVERKWNRWINHWEFEDEEED